jgi:hypothetical protein
LKLGINEKEKGDIYQVSGRKGKKKEKKERIYQSNFTEVHYRQHLQYHQ